MTIDTALTLGRLKELQALDRLRQGLVLTATDPGWVYVLAAMDARAQALRELLRREDPQVLRDLEEQLAEACAQGTDSPFETMETSCAVNVPASARVH